MKKILISVWAITFLMACISSKILAQPASLGWKGKEIIPLSSFTDKNKWIPGFNHGTGDSCFVTTNDNCVFLHWKFGPGKRDKYSQCYQIINPTISLSNKDIFGIDVKGSKCSSNCDVKIKFENGLHQANYRWKGLASITRWCERISALKNQFEDTVQMNWSSINVVSLEVTDTVNNDVAADSGTVVFKKLLLDSVSYWTRTNTFETLKDSSILPIVTKQTVKAILNRQNDHTGLFCTWLANKSSYLYGQGLVLKILSIEGNWRNSQPIDSCARAAEKLALFLANHQDKLGYWPRAWYTETGNILQNLEDNGTVWMGDFPWIITGLQNYYKKSLDIRVKIALDKARLFLYTLIESNGKFYTINPNTLAKHEVTSSEAYAAAILSVYELGDTAKANAMLQYIDNKTWDNKLKYWKEAIYSPRIVLFANTWLSPFFKKTSSAQKSLDALSFVGKALYTKGPGQPDGFDGIGPVATWYEGTLTYICAGGPGSNALFYNLINYRYSDGTVPHYNDSIDNIAGIWAVKWSSLDGTAWLYFAASKKSPFDIIGSIPRTDGEAKKVFIHCMGWFGDSLASNDDKLRNWNYGCAHTPLIGRYDSQSWALQTYHILLSHSCGIDGMIMNVKDDFDDQSMKKIISNIKRLRDMDSMNFKYDFAISYDDQGMDKSSPFDTATAKFTYLRDNILPNSKNYLYYYNKPAIFIFNYKYPNPYLSPKDYDTTLGAVFPTNRPIVIWNEIEAPEVANSYYPWVQGWAADGSNWGKVYLDWYYPAIANTLGLDFATGGVWAGFDDRSCSWGQHRWIDRKNGAVYDSTWKYLNNYSGTLPLKWVVTETWNDWNEGTEIEPSKEYRYKYLINTINNINTFKDTIISTDTCKFEAARKIYQASYMIEHHQRDSAKYYVNLKNAIKYFLLNNCEMAIKSIDTITGNKTLITKGTDIKIYPNPVNNKLYVEISDGNPATIEIITLKGQVVLSRKIKNQVEVVDISGFSKGAYTVKITMKDKVTVRKIVLQ